MVWLRGVAVQLVASGQLSTAVALPCPSSTSRHSLIGHFIPETEFLEGHKLELDNYLKARVRARTGGVVVPGVGVCSVWS